MQIIQKSNFVICLAVALTMPVLAENPTQDTNQAVQYFSQELSFKTNPYGVKRGLDEKATDVNIVDVRTVKDYAEGHIPGAINVPYEKHDSFDGAETEFAMLKKDKMNIIYCYTPECNLAQKAAKKFASLGYPVKEMIGGFESWKNHKYPVEK